MLAKPYNLKRFSVFLHYAFYIMHCLAIVHLLTQLLKLSQMLAKPYNLKRFSVFLHYALCILHYALFGYRTFVDTITEVKSNVCEAL